VKAAPFVYHAPETVDEVVALLAEHGDDAKLLAGGQSLMPLLALRLAAPAHVVDITRVESLRATTGATADRGLRIAAGTTQRSAERDPAITGANPLLAEVLPHIAHPPIRTRGTVCGSIAHADPAAEIPALMLALDAQLSLRTARGVRSVDARDFFVSYLDTVVEPDELLEHVDLPPWPSDAGWSFHELARRHGDFAIAGVGAVVVIEQGIVREARVACCGVASTPIRLDAVERALVGCAFTPGRARDSLLDDVSALARDAVDPPGDVHAPASYRRHLTGVLLRRALAEAAERAGGAGVTIEVGEA
jgi:carbon-monoxide dehydrogenase medium subunit